MHTILAQLHQDHINLDRLLKRLEQETQVLMAGGAPDLHLMIEITDYIHEYSDRVHHPRENRVYARLENYDNDQAIRQELATLYQQHNDLPGLTGSFMHTLDHALHLDMAASRDQLGREIQAFIEAQRGHMNLEEGRVFPLIDHTLTQQDWDLLEVEDMTDADPLFGQTQNHFLNLKAALSL
ncbi:MAG: hemerythrin domain-containing protein [Thiothrix sp.]|nr:hemerythrin domain-containing protein [Thiothrix sp.]HPE61766.1 hemerythrin domain-containing protein [Thiolinea sp.]